MTRNVCSLSAIICLVGVHLGFCWEVTPQVAYEDDWAFNGPKDMRKARHKRKPAVAKALGDIPRAAMHKDSASAPAGGPAGPAGPAGPGGPGPAPGPAPGPVPAPAPLTWEEKMAKMKKDMTKKVGDSFDADYVIDRPTQSPIPFKHIAFPVGPYHDMFPDDGSLPAGPGPAPAPPGQGPSPAPMGYIPFTEASLPDHIEYKDKDQMTKNWRLEYGPEGPQRDPKLVHGPFIDRPFKGWSANPTQAPPPRPEFGFMPRGPFGR